MNTRKLHRVVGLAFSLFFLITALTGIVLLWRKAEIYGKETKGLLISLHNWEIGAQYLGVILGAGLIFMSVSGLVMYIRSAKRSPRASSKQMKIDQQ